MEFVVETLLDILDYTTEDAEDLTHKITTKVPSSGSILHEIAEQKGVEVQFSTKQRLLPS